MKLLLTACALLVTLGAGCGWASKSPKPAARLEDASFLINGEPVTLRDGIAKGPAGTPGSVRLLKPNATGDLDGDGDFDTVVYLERVGNDGDTYLYAAAVLNVLGNFLGTEANYLAQDADPAGLEFRQGTVAVGFVERAKPGLPPPTAASRHLQLDHAGLLPVHR